MENYFNYFTEIEEYYLRRRSGGLLLSTLDWALIESWKDAGIPLEAALRGIDTAFDRYQQRPSNSKKINSLAYCAQAVLAAAEEMKEAAVGTANSAPLASSGDKSFAAPETATFLLRNAARLDATQLPERDGVSVAAVLREIAARLRALADEVQLAKAPSLEDIERQLTVLEEKLFAALLMVTLDEEIVSVRTEVDHDLQPYRRKVPGSQIEQLHKQYVNKRLLSKYDLPRLSLFYM